MFLVTTLVVTAQTKPKSKARQPSQAEINKMMEDAMKSEGMSKEEQAEMKKMMGNVMPAIMEQKGTIVNYPTFSNNKELVPAKDAARINAVAKKAIAPSEIGNYAASLYNKIMAKGKPAEIVLVKQVLAKASTANDMNAAAITAMLQGHAEAGTFTGNKGLFK